MKIEILQETLSNLPDLENRLQSWRNTIKNLHDAEKDMLEQAIRILKIYPCEDVDTFKYNIDVNYEIINYYKQLFQSLIDRLELPNDAYKERIYEIQKKEFKIKIKEFRLSEGIRCNDLALKYAQDYTKSYNTNTNKWDYIKQCNDMITPFLFQPGIYPCNDAEERELFYTEFHGFNPESFVSVFRDKLKYLMSLMK